MAAVAALALLAGACTRGATGATNAKPPDLYAATPSLSDIRTLLGDSNWWPGPPSFGVRPLDGASMSLKERFSVTQHFVHVGTAETFVVDYTLWNTTSAATSYMSGIQTALGTPVAGPKVGDQALYYGVQGSSNAAPYGTLTFVRVGQIVATITWDLKDGFPHVSQLGKIASKVVSRLKDVISGKLHGSSSAGFDSSLLPPANTDITQLGTATISVESALVMIGATTIDALAQALRVHGVTDVVFGDYALNSDTRMEVLASVFTFVVAKDATDWVAPFIDVIPAGQDGYYDSAHGWYLFPFAAGTKAAILICRSSAETEAASRACEAPLSHVAASWKLSLTA